MGYISFEWDKTKSTKNEEKHGVSFKEAQSVFYDESAVEFFDVPHSDDEDRF
ncbi:MAG: BrnT family toxin, partial [Spirochaetales bacterium]|nr:BrnT family toxin [Spirochaetales bacterium]